MAANDYLDEEYFQIQDLLSILTDSLPKLELDAINNVHDLVSTLVEQNKAYGKKIISLFETLDSLYKSSNPLEASPGTASPDFNSRLHQKIQDYEDLVKRLTTENEDFSSQIKQLSNQIESLKYQNQGNLGGSFSEKKSTSISNMSPSPLPKGSKSGTASREVSLELENLFGNAEYKKGVELLTQIDYKKPLNVGPEKFNTWLTIANRMKDSSFNEVLNKLKILLTFAEKDEEEAEGGLDDSLDKPSQTVAEKIYSLLDEKLPKIILKSEYRIESQKQQEMVGGLENEEENLLKSGRLQDSMEEALDDDNLTGEQLKLKVRYLNSKVEQLEKILREKEHGEGQEVQGKARGAGEYEDQDELIRTNERLLQDLQQQADNTLKLESQAREVIDAYEDLKDKYEGILKEIADYDIKNQDLVDQVKENRDFIDRLLQENARLKEQYEFSEKLEDLEKFMEQLQEKDSKIKALSEELSLLKEYQKTPRESYSDPKRYINDTPSESLRGAKGQAVVETGLQIQSTFLYSLRQMLSDLRGPILEILKNLGLDLPARLTVPPLNDELDVPTTEAQRLLKSNNAILRDIASELNFVKGSTASISGDVSNANYRSLADKYNSFTSRVTQAEEKLFENLTNSIQTVSELITLLNEVSASSKVGGQMSQVHTLLQGLHTNITRTIQEYPDFSSELGVSKGQASDMSSPPRKPNHSFKDKLVRDQSDIKTKLRSTLQHLESYQANEIYSKLCLEIERNQELQDQIETKNVAIYRQHLVYNEGIERGNRSLEQLVKLADSEEAQGLLEFILDEISTVKSKLREIVEANKTGGWTMPEAILKVEQEFEEQKEMWKKTLRDLEEANEKKIEQFIREIEGERKAHDITHKKLLQLQKELSEKSTRVVEELKLEVESLTRKIREREFDLEEKEREIDVLKRQVRDLEKERSGIVNQLDRMKGDISSIGHEKGRLREEKDEMRKALENINDELEVLRRNSAQKNNELDQLRREVLELNGENDEIAGRLAQLQDVNQEMQVALDKARSENKALSQQLNEAFEKRQKEVESLRRELEEVERENEELKDYKSSTEVLFKKTNEQVDHLKISYFSDINNLKEENNALQTQKRQFVGDIERKNQEVMKLNQMLDSLQDFSNKQLETLKEREEKLGLLTTQKRETEQYVRDLERRVEELSEKNRRYSESINQNTADVQTLKEEVHQLMEKQAGLQRDLVLSKQRNEELAHENRILSEAREDINSSKGFLEDKVKKMNEILQITKNELKNNRELLEEKNLDLTNKEHEIMDLKESMRRERESASQADLVPRLKRELQIKGDELVEIRRDYKRSLEQIEKLNIEIDTLRVSTRMGDQHMREVERANDINRNMAIEVETLRKSVRQRDEQFSMERDNYEREIQLMRKKVNDMQTIIDTKDKQMKNVPKSYSESLKSSTSSNAGNSSYYSSLIESKDLEIKRLTQIVKSLTENLRDTQESKYKLKK